MRLLPNAQRGVLEMPPLRQRANLNNAALLPRVPHLVPGSPTHNSGVPMLLYKIIFPKTHNFLDGILGAVAGPLIGGLFGYEGQSEVNETNQQIASQNTAFNAAEADKARIFNAAQAGEQRDWAERLSGSAYQRAIGDMKAAGLNPMLAYSQGGASTPGGASASGQAATAAANPVIGNKNLAAVSSAGAAAQVAQTMAQTENTRAQTENTKADTALKTADLPRMQLGADLTKEQIGYVKNQAREMMERVYGTYWETTLREQKAKLGEVEAVIAKLVADKERVTTETVLNRLDIKGEAGAASRYYENMGPTTYGLRDAASLINSAATGRRALGSGIHRRP